MLKIKEHIKKHIKMIRGTADGAFAHCLFCIQFGQTAFFFIRRKKYGLFALLFFAPDPNDWLKKKPFRMKFKRRKKKRNMTIIG
jgi:hypothetical protein